MGRRLLHWKLTKMWVLAIMALPGLVEAATLERLSLDDMIRQSTGIVAGRVTGAAPLRRGSVLYTQYRVRVSGQYKGQFGQEVQVCVPGGRDGALTQTFSGSPKLVEGQEYMLFLWAGRSGLNQVIGLSQGLFDVKRNPAGDSIVSRGAAEAAMVDSSGRLVEDTPVSLRLGEMVDRIHRTLAGARQ